jgi:glutamine cyclotransferase
MIRILPLIIFITIAFVFLSGCSKVPTDPDDPFLNLAITEFTIKVLHSYPHDINAFTQGLVYHNGFFYEGTGLYGKSSLRRVDVETGEVQQQRDLEAKYFGEGITIFEDNIYQLTWLEKRGFIYNTNDFDSLGLFSYNHEGWGITHNGTELIISDGTAHIRFLDPTTLQLIRMVEVNSGDTPLKNLNELEYIEGMIYANIWLTDWIVVIDPQNGKVTGRIDLSGLLDPKDRTASTDVLNGIAYDVDKKRLFVTGKRWPKVFEIELVEY